ncbi:c-type cytochrome [Roseinatronobacter monicus]|uniref:Cbb3-type cytochrome c oxidase subunit III n=1 Tax=Roseinatronobacter monicus TaxID=393481 RepID=A0A543KGC3_9RHOB|nr:c-type cytochrome [Roseinatronobacter monicus]TQM94133.1 cbb3-type cytochrome c oxidase subunit III [Roseinatronobacter monicus]
MKTLTSASAAIILALPAFATDITTIDVAESDEFGHYLTDNLGRPVYVFSTDTPASDDAQAQISCITSACRDAWALVTTTGDPQAGEGVDPALLGMTQVNAQTFVTYEGWPLYYAVHNKGAEMPHDSRVEAFGGEWTLVAADMQADHGDIEAGQTLYAAQCAQCHGRTGRGMASFPSITGQDADYISDMLMRYRAGETIGSNTALMRPVAAELSDTDIADLAAYISAEFQ